MLLLLLAAGSLSAVETQSRGYAIPMIDLTVQKQRKIIVERENGQYLGHPTTVLLEDDKRMLIVYSKGRGEGESPYIVSVRL